MHRTGRMISLQNILSWHNHFLISWDHSFDPFRNLKSSPWLSGNKLSPTVQLWFIPAWDPELAGGWWWAVWAWALTPPSSLQVSAGESEVTGGRAGLASKNSHVMFMFYVEKIISTGFLPWWSGRLKSELFLKWFDGANFLLLAGWSPGMMNQSSSVITSRTKLTIVDWNEKLILLQFCWKKFR